MSSLRQARWRARAEVRQNLARGLWWLVRVGLTGAALCTRGQGAVHTVQVTPPRPTFRRRWREEAQLLGEVERGNGELAKFLAGIAPRAQH